MAERSPIECLTHAIQNLWSGQIEVLHAQAPIGQIVLCEGRIAWATSVGQTETLGIFLWRLGRISRGDLTEVQRKYADHHGRMKLGEILEESGLLNRTVLRRCLLLHTRSAIENLLSYPAARARMIEGNHRIDEKIVFGPEEVVPQDFATDLVRDLCPVNTLVRSWYTRNAENAVLESFFELQGYLASAVISADGDVLAGHVDHESIDLSLLAVFVASMLEASSRAVRPTCLEGVNFIELDCTNGWLASRWIDEDHHFLVLVLIDQDGNPSLTRYQIKTAIPSLVTWLLRGKEIHGLQPSASSPSPAAASPVPASQHPPAADLGRSEVIQAAPAFASNKRDVAHLFVNSTKPDPPSRSADVFSSSWAKPRVAQDDAFSTALSRKKDKK